MARMDRDDFRQVMDDYNHNAPAGGGNTSEDLLMIGLGVLLVIGGLLGATHWLDMHFHWHLEQWMKHRLNIQ